MITPKNSLSLLCLTLVFMVGIQELQSAPTFVSEPVVEANPNNSAPLVALVKFEPGEAITGTTIQIESGVHEWSFEYDGDRDTKGGLPVIGLRPGQAHKLMVTVKNSDGETLDSSPLTFQAPDLPELPEEFPKIRLAKLEVEKAEPGYRLFNPRRRIPRDTQAGNEEERRFGESFGMLLIVDQQGNPVWYYRTESRIAGFNYDKKRQRILYVTADHRVVEIDLLGNVTSTWVAKNRPQEKTVEGATQIDALTFHHDADLLESGNLLALSTERRKVSDYFTSEWEEDAPRKDQWVMGDRILEATPEGEILWDWKAFDHLPVERIGYETFSSYWKRRGFPETIDWSHANEVTKLANGHVMVNYRYQSAVVTFDPQTEEIQWIFGEPSGWPKNLQQKLIRLEGDARWPWHQHAPQFTSRDTLLLFDNGNYRARPFEEPAAVDETWSRAVEYEVDLEAKVARQIWTSETAYQPNERVVTIAMGSATEMPETGNILAGYGAILDPEQIGEITWKNRAQFGQVTRCVEYTRTSPAEIVWDLRLEPTGNDPKIGWNLFGLQAIGEMNP